MWRGKKNYKKKRNRCISDNQRVIGKTAKNAKIIAKIITTNIWNYEEKALTLHLQNLA